MPIATVKSVQTDQQVVALTFDDGPHPVFTPKALEALHKYQHQATWFVLGDRAAARLNLLNDIYREGNIIGVHSYDHIYLTGLSFGQITSQLGRTKALIKQATGQFWPYFRPPYGAFNQTVLDAAESLGFQWNVLWSVDPRDYASSPGQITGRVLTALQPGAIIILHEVTASTTQALPVILEEMNNRGFRSVTLERLLEYRPPLQCRTLTVVDPYMRGEDVRAVQQALTARKFNCGTVDGIYGPVTAAAVARFQFTNKLPSTGVVDPETYKELQIKCF